MHVVIAPPVSLGRSCAQHGTVFCTCPAPRDESPKRTKERAERLLRLIEKEIGMPHYKNGQPAKAGHFVQGRGYNMKAEIRGYLLRVTPGAQTCNVVIGVTEAKHDADPNVGRAEPQTEFYPSGPSIEYGQADAFDQVPEPDAAY